MTAPAALGFARPLILWPASWLSGIPESQLRIALAHELAHLRRHDYLVNLFQLLAEALLFFNAAVWWISRRIRVEREACCDKAAARVAGSELEVARSLASLAGALPFETSAAALSWSGRRSALGERIERLLHPRGRTPVRLPWTGSLLCLLLGGAFLYGCKETGDTLAEAIVPHEKRIEQMSEIETEWSSSSVEERDYGEEDRVRLRFHLETADGKPIPDDAHLRVHYEVPRSSGVSSHTLHRHRGSTASADGTALDFAYRIEFGRTCLAVQAEGYAPRFAGPFLPIPGGTLDAGDIVLRPGFRAAIRLTGPDGEPAPGARARGNFLGPFLKTNRGQAWIRERRPQDDGRLFFEHAAHFPLELTAVAPGYEKARRTVELEPDGTIDWRLPRAEPVRGIVVSARSGRPVAGTEVLRVFESSTTAQTGYSPLRADSWAVTDAQGSFVLDTLEDGAIYNVAVRAEGFAPRFVQGLRTGMEPPWIELEPPLTVSGRFIGLRPADLDEDGRLEIERSYSFQVSEDLSYAERRWNRIRFRWKMGWHRSNWRTSGRPR